MITVAALSPSLDLTYQLDSYELGRLHRSAGPVAVAGGKALNMARAARAMGADVVVVTLLGGPTGARVRALAEAEGMPLLVVASDAETRTCTSVAAAGELTEIYEDSRPVAPAVLVGFQAVLRERLRQRPGWLSVSGRGPGGAPGAVAELIRLGRTCGTAAALDTHGDSLPGSAAAGPALVKINRAEAAELLGDRRDADLATMAVRIRDRTGAAVVLTDGTAGAVAVDDAGVVVVAAPTLHGSFPVGSGDSFLGGLLAALDEDLSLAAALRLGTGCAVANALVPGQGHFDRALARRIAAETRLG